MQENYESPIDLDSPVEKDEILLNAIVKGQDISASYLGDTNRKFRIYRYNQEVYAVLYDESTSTAIDFVSMWRSHKGEEKEEQKYLGSGVYGDVYQKTKDKAVKIMKTNSRPQERRIQNNLDILEQKFFLKENNIEQYFILGLWNLKNGAFNMKLSH